MSGFAFALRGAAEGFGQGVIDEAARKREDALRAAEQAREDMIRQTEREQELEDYERRRGDELEDYDTRRSDQLDDYERDRGDVLEDEERGYTRDAEEEARIAETLRGAGLEPEADFDREGMDPNAIAALARFEALTGFVPNVNSAHRDEDHNDRVGGARGSKHLDGQAFDIDVSGMSEEEQEALIVAAREAGFGGIGIYGDGSMHFDIGPQRDWGPSRSRDSTPAWAKEALETPVGQHGDFYDIVADDEASPEAREIAEEALDPDGDDDVTVSGEYWRTSPDGKTRTRMQRLSDGTSREATDDSGEPITEPVTTGSDDDDDDDGLTDWTVADESDILSEIEDRMNEVMDGWAINPSMPAEIADELPAMKEAAREMIIELVRGGKSPSQAWSEVRRAAEDDLSDGKYDGLNASAEDAGEEPITREEYDALPSGARYTAPDGTQRIKP